jgi:hypothetical protein
MEVRFSVCNDGQVDAQLGPDRPIFNLALSDSISSLPPRGQPGNGPSTYWTNHADRGTRQAHERSDYRPFTFGNETLLCLRGDDVVAKYEYAEPDELGETMPLSDFLALLSEWRRRVEQSASTATTSLRETYRRNPASGPTEAPGRNLRSGRGARGLPGTWADATKEAISRTVWWSSPVAEHKRPRRAHRPPRSPPLRGDLRVPFSRPKSSVT